MSPSQYTALTHSATPFPIHGYFVESKRWGEGKKPKLFLGSAITFGGIIDKIHRDRDIDRPISRVEIEVLTVCYITTQPNSSTISHCNFARSIFLYSTTF